MMSATESVETPEGTLSFDATREEWTLAARGGAERVRIAASKAVALLALAASLTPGVAFAVSTGGYGSSE